MKKKKKMKKQHAQKKKSVNKKGSSAFEKPSKKRKNGKNRNKLKGKKSKGRLASKKVWKKRKQSKRKYRNKNNCLPRFIEYSRFNEMKARSIISQVNRINKFKDIQDKKREKKGSFKGTYNILLSALGGNASAPKCDGEPIDAKAKQSKHIGMIFKIILLFGCNVFLDTLKTLKECETTVDDLCNYQLNATYNATLQQCLAAATKFKADFKICFAQNQIDPCKCVNDIDRVNFDKMKNCSTKAANDEVKEKKRTCIEGINNFFKE